MINTGNKHGSSSKLQELWGPITFFIVDEISMVGAAFFAQLSARIRIGKGEDTLGRGKPFGGINVLFLGDLCQLKPPQQLSLYSYALVSRPSFEETRNNNGLDGMLGALLWRNINSVVILRKNQRQAKDPIFAQFLENVRTKSWDTPINSEVWSQTRYIDYLRQRQVSHVTESNPDSLPDFWDAPVVVGHKVLRDALNAHLVRYNADVCQREVGVFHSCDSIRGKPIKGKLQEQLWNLPANRCGELIGRLPLFIGMKVMVTENIALANKVVNGAEGIVTKIVSYTGEGGKRYADAVYVDIPGSNLQIPGLPVDTAVLAPVPLSINFDMKQYKADVTTKSFRRKQVPLLPSYSYTDFKSQGRSLDKCIVDLTTARGQGVYVMLSRVRNLQGLLILRWFSPTQLFQRMPEELRKELRRLEELDRATTKQVDNEFMENPSAMGDGVRLSQSSR